MSVPSPPTHLVGVRGGVGGEVGVPCYTTGACIFKVGAMEIFCPDKPLCKFHKLWELSAFGSLMVYSHN